MRKRLDDMLVLVSRLQDRNGDVRHVLRQDRQIRSEVTSYLDDVLWLAQRPAPEPSAARMAAGREHLLAMLGGKKRRRRLGPRLRIVGAVATATLLFATAFTAQSATNGMPAPVEQVLQSIGLEHQPTAVATPSVTTEPLPRQETLPASLRAP